MTRRTQRAVLPPRTDLRTRRERVGARAMAGGLDLYEGLKSRVLVDVTRPGEDPFYRAPQGLDASPSGPGGRRAARRSSGLPPHGAGCCLAA